MRRAAFQFLHRVTRPIATGAIVLAAVGTAGAGVAIHRNCTRQSLLQQQQLGSAQEDARQDAEQVDRLAQLEMLSKSLQDTTNDSGVNIMTLWEMYDMLPHFEAHVKQLLIHGVVAPIRADFAVALATRSAENFYLLAPLLLSSDSRRRNEYFYRHLVLLLRDIHDEHDCDFRSQHVHWPGKFEETREAIDCLKDSCGKSEMMSDASFLASEIRRILNPHHDLIGRSSMSWNELQQKRRAFNQAETENFHTHTTPAHH